MGDSDGEEERVAVRVAPPDRAAEAERLPLTEAEDELETVWDREPGAERDVVDVSEDDLVPLEEAVEVVEELEERVAAEERLVVAVAEELLLGLPLPLEEVVEVTLLDCVLEAVALLELVTVREEVKEPVDVLLLVEVLESTAELVEVREVVDDLDEVALLVEVKLLREDGEDGFEGLAVEVGLPLLVVVRVELPDIVGSAPAAINSLGHGTKDGNG